MADYTDLLITDNDLTLDVGGEPQLIYDADCIVQDIKHLIRDSGLLVGIVGQRNQIKVDDVLLQLTLLIEDDVRLIPGTVDITQTDTGTFFVQASTYDYGDVTLTASN